MIEPPCPTCHVLGAQSLTLRLHCLDGITARFAVPLSEFYAFLANDKAEGIA